MKRSKSLGIASVTSLILSSLSAQAQVSRLEAVSYSDAATMGLQAQGASLLVGNGYNNGSVSGDGRYVVFSSAANNLAAADTNLKYDVFLHDRHHGVTSLLSQSTGGTLGNGDSTEPAISKDGRYIVFVSQASNLVANDTNTERDIFVRDRVLGTTTRVSITSSGVQGNSASIDPSISSDGSVVAFTSGAKNLVASDTNNFTNVFRHNRSTGVTSLISAGTGGLPGNGESNNADISADGATIAFSSSASDLVAGDSNNNPDIFASNTGIITRLSKSSSGVQGNNLSFAQDVSDNGRYVAFQSFATNLVAASDTNDSADIFLHDRLSNTTVRLSQTALGVQGNDGSFGPAISGDGTKVSFTSFASNLIAGDTNIFGDIYRKDIGSGLIIRTSISSAGSQANSGSLASSMSTDGDVLVFDSDATNLVSSDTNAVHDVFSQEIKSGVTRRLSLPSDSASNSNSFACCRRQISGDGRYTVFQSNATNLVVGDTNGTSDVFVHDRIEGVTRRASVSSFGVQANGVSVAPTISRDGRFVAFRSTATNIVTTDVNGIVSDIFVKDLVTGQTNIVSLSNAGTQSGFDIGSAPSISADGRYIAFTTRGDLVATPGPNVTHLYVRDTQSNLTTRENIGNGGDIANSDSESPSISADGRYLAFSSGASNLVANDTNAKFDVFVRDRQSASVTRVSVPQLWGVYEGNNHSRHPAISDNGRVIAYESIATNLLLTAVGVTPDTNALSDIFVANTLTGGSMRRASVASGGAQGNGASTRAAISGDGRFVGYNSLSNNLTVADTNAVDDIFATDVAAATPATSRLSVDAIGNQGTGASSAASLSTDGSQAVFDSTTQAAWILDAGQNGALSDIFWIKRSIAP